MNPGVPTLIFDHHHQPWQFVSPEPGFTSFIYKQGEKIQGFYPWTIEKEFTKLARPQPQQKIIRQGKYDCAAAALAMLTNESLFTVKRTMGKLGWRNDNYGASGKIIVAAARDLGYDLIYQKGIDIAENIGPALISVSSLNIPQMGHLVTWTGTELLDPNFEVPGRHYWGPEWHPSKMLACEAFILSPKILSSTAQLLVDYSLK